MATTYNLSDVFISYSRRDTDFAKRLFERLKVDEFEVWADWEDIPKSVDWWQEIQAGIEGSDAFLFIISPDSVISDVCHREIEHARTNNKRLIPVLHREVSGAELQARMHSSVSSHNWIYFRESDDFDHAYQILKDVMRTDFNHVRLHTRLLVRARDWEEKEREVSLLLRDKDLLEAENWQATAVGKQPPSTPLHGAFIAASRQAQNQRTRLLLGATAVGLVIALLLAIFGLVQSQAAQTALATSEARGTAVAQQAGTATVAQGEAQVNATLSADNAATAQANALLAQAAEATASRRLEIAQSLLWANDAQGLFAGGDPAKALALALEANRIPDSPPLAQAALADLAYQPGLRARYRVKDGLITSVVLTPDGRSAFINWTDNVTADVIWLDLETDAIIGTLESGFDSDFGLLLSPEGATLAVVGCVAWSEEGWCSEFGVVFFDLTRGLAAEPSAPITGLSRSDVLQFSPDGEELVVGDCAEWNDDGVCLAGDVSLWSVPQGELLRRWQGHEAQIMRVAFSPDGRELLTAGWDGSLIMWDVVRGRAEWDGADYVDGYDVGLIAFSPDGRSVMTAPRDGSVVLRDAATGRIEWTDIDNISGIPVSSIVFHPDSRTAYTVSGADEIRAWNIPTGTEVFSILNLPGSTWKFIISPDGSFLSAGLSDKFVYVWSADNGDLLARLAGNTEQIFSLAFSSNQQQLWGIEQYGMAVRWDVRDGQIDGYLATGYDPQWGRITYSPDGRLVVATGLDGTIRVMDSASGEILWEEQPYIPQLINVAISPDGRTLFSAGCTESTGDNYCVESVVLQWNIASGEQMQTFATGSASWDNPLALSPDGRRLLIGSCAVFDFGTCYQGLVTEWDIATGEEVRRYSDISFAARALAFSADGRDWFVGCGGWFDQTVSCQPGQVIQVNPETGQIIQSFGGEDLYVTSLKVSPDGRYLAVGANVLTLWDINTGQLVRQFSGHEDYIVDLDFSPDGSKLLSVAEDSTGILWDVSEGQPLRRLRGHRASLSGAAISPDGEQMITAGTDGRIIRWRFEPLSGLMRWAETNRLVDALTCVDRLTYNIQPFCAESTPES